MSIDDHGTYIIKTERPGLPEAEKYALLNKAGAPVVQLLDVIEGQSGRRLVLEKPHLSLSMARHRQALTGYWIG